MAHSTELLRQYHQSGDEAAFAELVRQELDLVYSTALRKVGDPNLARDVSQIVFADVVKRAQLLSQFSSLSGWLYRHTGFVAGKLQRHEMRRRQRESHSLELEDNRLVTHPAGTEEILPLLDWALTRLKESDREVLILRFMRELAVQEVGQVLGITENAARMRIDRALARIRSVLCKRGIVSTSASAVAALTALTVPAPVGIAAGVTASALAATTSVSMLSTGFIHFLTHLSMNKTAAIGAIAVAVAITSSAFKQHQVEKLRREIADLRGKDSEMAELRARNQQLESVQVDTDELARLRAAQGELLRLRGEVGLLRERLRDPHGSQPNGGNMAAGLVAVQPQAAGDLGPGAYQADAWTNQGFVTPQSSAMTFFWSLKGGHVKEYSESLGKTNLLAFPVEWAHAIGAIRVSQFSETSFSQELPMVTLVHELSDGSSQKTFLAFTNVDGQWRIKSMTGYPIVVHVRRVSGE